MIPLRADPTMVSDLVFFRAAATSLSFVKAGRELSVTQSAVSQRIQRLEARLGVALFRRHRSGMQLTGQGELLFSAIRNAFGAIDDAVAAVQAMVTQQPVVISCVPSLALEWLTSRLVDFYKFRPDIAVSLQAEIDNPSDQELERQNFDIAIRYGPVRPSVGFVVLEQAEQVFPVLSPQLAEQIAADPRQQVTLLHDALPWPDPDGQRAEWDTWIAHHGVPVPNPTRDAFANLVQLCYRSAMGGAGIAMGRKLVVRRHLAGGTLVRLQNAPSIAMLRYFVVTPPGPMRPVVETVLGWLTAQLMEDLR